MYTDADFTVNEEGFTVVDIESSNLPVVTIDTYQMFNTDSYVEQEIDWYNEEHDTELGYDDFEWEYDNEGILKGLAELSVEAVVEQLPVDSPIQSIEVVGTWSPRYYNFQTDSYTGRYTVDMEALEEWAAEEKFDVDAYVQEHWQSYDGFISFVPGALEDHPEAMTKYLMIEAYIRETIERDAYNMHMWEGMHEVFMNTVTATVKVTEDN